ncbi:MAG: magnesium transporter, partial [Eubacteriaceae bacterium]|nr:magnesium transporter [Eubacteriaceae bacterium]
LIGIVTVDDIIDVLVEEQDEDIIRMGGGTESEDIDEPVKDSVRKRLPWLAILFGLSMLVSSVVGKFEVVLAVLPLAMAFQSLVLDMAGNVGTQSLAVTIRALTDDSLTASDKLKLVFKELRVGLLNGLILGVLAFVGVGAYIYVFKTHDLKSAFAISACIGTALIVAMMISSFVGSGIPMLFKKIGVDPAVASGPLITTLNDMVAVVCYYGLIWILLINVMNVSF